MQRLTFTPAIEGSDREFRHSNPLNVRDFGISWLGLIDKESGFCVFDTSTNGFRAAGIDIYGELA